MTTERPPLGTVGWIDLTVDDATGALDFYRHVGEGRLTELLGDSQLESDVYLRLAFMANDGTSVFDQILEMLPDDILADLHGFGKITEHVIGISQIKHKI